MNSKMDDFIREQIEIVRKKILETDESMSDYEAMKIIETTVILNGWKFDLQECRKIISKVYAKTRKKLGILDTYVNDETINEIMVNGKNEIFLERRNGIVKVDNKFDTTEELEDVIRNIAAGVHREINEMNPILDARLENGSRVNAVYKNVAVGGPVLTIRKFAKERITIEEMVKKGTLTDSCAEFLETIVKSGYNIFVSGGTSSGKTTFLNALSDFIPKDERVVVIEDSTELQLNHIENLVQMECRNANSLGKGTVSMDMLIKTSLRMRPDRIIVGEVRGKEVNQMLQAMNTGHDGSMSTGHGNSVAGMLRRLEAMYLMSTQIPIDAIRAQIVEGIDIMIHLGRFSDGLRKVLEIQELVDFENGKYVLNPLFKLDATNTLMKTDNDLLNKSKRRLKTLDYDYAL